MEAPPPDLPPEVEHHAAAPYTAVGHVEADPHRVSRFCKVTVNLITALILACLAGWLVADDLEYPGDHLFQLSMSLPALALFLVGLSIAAFFFAIFPKRILFLTGLLVIVRGAIGYPLNVWVDNSTAATAVSIAIAVLALYYLLGSFSRFLYVADRPWMHYKHTIGILGIILLLVVLAIPFTLLGYSHAGRNLMGDYVRISRNGLSLVERVFAKEGQLVYLVGMMHIGNGAYYEELQERLSATPEGDGTRRLVLTEGVSDNGKLLPESFTSGQTYARWASLLGLEVQDSFHGSGFGSGQAGDHTSADERILFRNADIDISELEASHQETLIALLSLLDETDPIKIMMAQSGKFDGREVEELFVQALIEDRNDSLMAEFTSTGPEYQEVYIPWGAAHLTDLEERLLALGYQIIQEEVRPIISFRGLLTPPDQ